MDIEYTRYCFFGLVRHHWYYIKEIYRYEIYVVRTGMIDLYVSFRMQLDGDMCTCAEILHVYICNETILIALCFY